MTISGRITDSDTGTPILGATINIVDSNLKATTGVDGKYSFTNSLLDNSDASIEVKAPGYNSFYTSAGFFYGNGDVDLYKQETDTVNDTTAESDAELSPVSISAAIKKPNYTIPIVLGSTSLVAFGVWLIYK